MNVDWTKLASLVGVLAGSVTFWVVLIASVKG